MKKVIQIINCFVIIILFGCSFNTNKQDRVFSYKIASKDEAVSYYLANEDYFNNFSEYDIKYRTQDKNGTLDSLKEYGTSQMLDFKDKEIDSINKAMAEIEEIIKENDYNLPKLDEIVFIKSSQKEEGGSVAYTHGSEIYMNNIIPIYLSTNEKNHQKGLSILAHEIFHCLTRSNSTFKKDMYGLINFTVADKDFVVPDSIKKMIISNPDVEHHNAYATFTINNEKKDCFMLNICTKAFENKGDEYIDNYKFILVPVDLKASDSDFYFIEESSDYLDIFGENTKYIADPEECLADNFSYALIYGLNGTMNYPNPEIIEGIINLLKTNKYN